MKSFGLLFIVAIVAFSCLDQFDVPVIASSPCVVVDGMITNEPGPYSVELYLTSNPNEDLNNPDRVTGAVVSIWDDAGNSEILTEESAGVYKTAAGGIQGIVGRSYQLKFTTLDGMVYESIPAKLQPAGQIERLYYEFKKNEINKNDLTLPQHVIHIYADASGEEGYSNLLRWRSSGIFYIETFPQLYPGGYIKVTDPRTGEEILVPIGAPLPCSIPDCRCCHCWVNDPDRKAVVSNNNAVNGVNFNRILLKKVVVDKWTFGAHQSDSAGKYYFEAEQLSVQPEIYDFWKLVSIQQQSGDNIFQPNAVSIKGNIECLSDNSKEAYGAFSVSGITRKSFFIYPAHFPIPLTPAPPREVVDCKDIFRNSTYDRPSFWEY